MMANGPSLKAAAAAPPAASAEPTSSGHSSGTAALSPPAGAAAAAAAGACASPAAVASPAATAAGPAAVSPAAAAAPAAAAVAAPAGPPPPPRAYAREWLYRLVMFPAYFTPCHGCCAGNRTPKREQLLTLFDTQAPGSVYCSHCPEFKTRNPYLLQVRVLTLVRPLCLTFVSDSCLT